MPSSTPPAPFAKRLARRLKRHYEQARDRAATTRQQRQSPVATGVVEHLDGRSITGWIEVAKGTPATQVGLYINDFEATTAAAIPVDNRNTDAEIRAFRFALSDFWKYTRQADKITVRFDGQVLPFSGRGTHYRPRTNGAESVATLKDKLAGGHVFASNGRLLLSKNLDLKWQADVMRLYSGVRAAVREIAGYDVFFIYGSLLGAVRDNAFIGHDVDFDSAYVSQYEDPEAVGRELADIARALIARGFNVESRVVTLHIYDPANHRARIDLFHLYFDDTQRLRFSWGVAGTTDFMKSQWDGVREIPFAGSTGLIPHNSEALVEAIYGASWNIPDAGFTWTGNRNKRASESRVPPKLGAEVNWDNFYTWTTTGGPSAFFDVVATDKQLPRTVIDLGCGDGRDTAAFAAAGRRAVGLDQSPVALRRARERVASLPDDQRPEFVRCDFDDRAALRAALDTIRAAEPDQPVLFYARFLLHTLEPDTQEALLAVLSESSRPGDHLALEFRTLADEELPKTYKLPYRRFLDAPALIADLADKYGYPAVSTDEGTGRASYENEDPYVSRVIARRVG